jgi:hypothetical protein
VAAFLQRGHGPKGAEDIDLKGSYMSKLPSNLPAILRDAGLKVKETDGWQNRGRPASTGGFDPVGVLCHHTATSKSTPNANVEKLLINGRSDLPGPLCHLGLQRDGTVVVIAAGRANHAGTAKKSGSVAAGDGNTLYIGIEAYNSGTGEPWSDAQYDAYVLLCAVLSTKITKSSVQTVRGHKETSVTGKIDPTFPMDAFRTKVGAKMKQLTGPVAKPSKPKTSRGARIDRALSDLKKSKGSGERGELIKQAITALEKIPKIR